MRRETEHEQVVFVEFRDGRPFSLVTRDEKRGQSYYDVEYCRRDDQLYYDLSGFGSFKVTARAGDTFWAAPDFPLTVEPGAIRRKSIPKKYPSLKDFRGSSGRFHDDLDESDCQYCSVCDDYLPTENSYQPCDHLWWCEDAGWWSTPDERCPPGCPDCLERGRETRAAGHPLVLIAEGYGTLHAEWWDPPEERWYRGYHPIAHGHGRAAEWSRVRREQEEGGRA